MKSVHRSRVGFDGTRKNRGAVLKNIQVAVPGTDLRRMLVMNRRVSRLRVQDLSVCGP